MPKPMVSVIIPAFNEASGIEATLENLLKQNYSPLEVIVVDNASTDDTAELARKYPVKILREEHKGTMWACECGRKEAGGDIIVRMDADCRPNGDWLARGVAHFAKPDVVVASGPYDYYDVGGFFRWFALFSQNSIYFAAHTLLQVFRHGGVTLGGNTFMRASALTKAGGFNTDITFYGDDTDIPKRLSKYGKCVFDRRLVMKTSGRRFKNEGILRLQTKYLFHFFRIVFT